MLLSPRVYSLAQVPDRGTRRCKIPGAFFERTSATHERAEELRSAKKMLLVHQAGSVKVGEIVRYTVTYTPSQDRILPPPSCLHVKIKNNAAIPLRAAYLHGPYTLYVAAYPSTYNPNKKFENPKDEGIPQFEPNLKAGGHWTAKLNIPERVRASAGSGQSDNPGDGESKSVTWVIEVVAQILFSNSASVSFEVLVGRDERSLDLGFAAIAGYGHASPGQVHDHQQGHGQREGRHHAQPKGIYSKAVQLVVEDTTSLWNKPPLPDWEREKSHVRSSLDLKLTRTKSSSSKISDGRPDSRGAERSRKKRKIHLVILTHGLHSNVGADMLYMKESIDAAAKQAREDGKKRRAEERRKKQGTTEEKAGHDASNNSTPAATAPLSGGQEDIPLDESIDDDNDEEVIVRGFLGNAVRTERGIQYLGKRLAKYVLAVTYPDQPFLATKKPVSRSVTENIPFVSAKDPLGKPTHQHSTIHRDHKKAEKLAYTYSSISFIGHSLGGLIQTYAIAYIQKHSPQFFEKIKPVNFVCMASPMLGLSNENPMYVKFALDFGLVGRTGQDLGLTWRPPTIARSGWSAMVGGLGGNAHRNHGQEDPGAKPLLRILPTGPAHQVLRQFRNRTVYSNVVNDGIVPLRTSCLLFLDWRGLGKVEKAKRENGLIGTMTSWGWAEITGANTAISNANLTVPAVDSQDESSDGGASTPVRRKDGTTVPQPPEGATDVDDTAQTAGQPRSSQYGLNPAAHHGNTVQGTVSATPLSGFLNLFKPTAKQTAPKRPEPSKKDSRMYKRSQVLSADQPDDESSASSVNGSNPSTSRTGSEETARKRPPATRGDSILEDPTNVLAPPRTTFFESAGDILNPPIPPLSWVLDPSTRARTIFHDRVYHPEDIPPPPLAKRTRTFRSSSDMSGGTADSSREPSMDGGGMRVEEKIARAYHKDLSWRKVLVRLEPDAHNNMIVRRMFANAYGWPVVKHLCDTHFADTFSATTRDEAEPAIDRAKGAGRVEEDGSEVKHQTAKKPPPVSDDELREAQNELASSPSSPPTAKSTPNAKQHPKVTRSESGVWSDHYFEGTTDDESEAEPDDRGAFQRFLSPAPKGKRRSQHAPSDQGEERRGTSEAEIADFLTSSPPPMESHRGLGPMPAGFFGPPQSPKGKASDRPRIPNSPNPPNASQALPADNHRHVQTLATEVGLRKSIEQQLSPERVSSREQAAGVGSDGGLAERLARMTVQGDKGSQGAQR